MKRSDLYREWARVLDMCESIGIPPLLAVRKNGGCEFVEMSISAFNDDADYSFALAIIEDRPVFVGDTLYDSGGYQDPHHVKSWIASPHSPVVACDRRLGNPALIVVRNGEMDYAAEIKKLSWNPPAPAPKFKVGQSVQTVDTMGFLANRLCHVIAINNVGSNEFAYNVVDYDTRSEYRIHESHLIEPQPARSVQVTLTDHEERIARIERLVHP